MPGRRSESTVHIVVTCTNRKRQVVPESLRLGNLREQQQGLRFAEWTRRLTAEPPTVRAHDLYGGQHWNIARGLPTLVGAPARLWVCSAGYGLVDVDAYLHPYAATFSIGNEDSVGRDKLETRQWWQRLTDWAGPSADKPRSFADLARQDPDATIVAVLSNTYLPACADDLRTAAGLLRSADRFTVIGPNLPARGLEDVVIPIPARLRSVVGEAFTFYMRAPPLTCCRKLWQTEPISAIGTFARWRCMLSTPLHPTPVVAHQGYACPTTRCASTSAPIAASKNQVPPGFCGDCETRASRVSKGGLSISTMRLQGRWRTSGE